MITKTESAKVFYRGNHQNYVTLIPAHNQCYWFADYFWWLYVDYKATAQEVTNELSFQASWTGKLYFNKYLS